MTVKTASPVVRHDGVMSSEPRADRPRRRSFGPAEKLRLLAGYESAAESGLGNAFLRENGLYSSLISEWRRTRDAGLLRGKTARNPVGAAVRRSDRDRRTARQLDVAQRRLARTEAALLIMGEAQALLEDLYESADTEPKSTGS
ncbi:MAG: transposase [Micromonosporaceae bacterium]|jgi:transposase-like protein|nr:transposase [Micromonosporaceae bacterium]